jgi:hypothetical protein
MQLEQSLSASLDATFVPVIKPPSVAFASLPAAPPHRRFCSISHRCTMLRVIFWLPPKQRNLLRCDCCRCCMWWSLITQLILNNWKPRTRQRDQISFVTSSPITPVQLCICEMFCYEIISRCRTRLSHASPASVNSLNCHLIPGSAAYLPSHWGCLASCVCACVIPLGLVYLWFCWANMWAVS